MKKCLFIILTAIFANKIIGAHLSGQLVSGQLEKDSYIVFNPESCLFTEEEIKELDEIIEYIATKNQYKNGDNGATHEDAHYGNIAVNLINSEAYWIPEDANWIDFGEPYRKSYLEKEIYTKPIITTLFRRIASALRAPPPETGYFLTLKLICSHEESHVALRKHQDGANYLFTLITNAKDIEGGEMFIYQLKETGRNLLQEDKYYFGDAGRFLFTGVAQAGAGYGIKERPDRREDESNCSPIVHGHTPWNKKGEHPTRNLVIVRVYYYSVKKNDEDDTYITAKKSYRNE